MKLQEILDRQNKIRGELQRMGTDDTVTEEGDGDLRDTLIQEYEDLDVRAKPLVERMEKIRGIEKAGASGEGTEAGTASRSAGPEFMQRHDPFENLDAVRNRMVTPKDMIERAKTAIELHSKARLFTSDDHAEAATRMAQRMPSAAQHMLLTGHEEYVEAFRAYLENPAQEIHRAAMSLTVANGGYLLPYVLDPSIVLTNAGSSNPYRRLASVKTTTSNAWQGVNSAGVNAAWLAEGITAADASPTVGQIQITPNKAAAWVFGSFEVMEDTNFGEQLPGLLADAKNRLEETAFAVGTGTLQPLGVLTALGTGQKVAAAGGTGGAFSGTWPTNANDVYNLQAALGARWRQSPSNAFVANITNINKIRGIDQYGGSAFWANYGQGAPEQLLGKPIHESTSITTATGTGTGTASAVLVYGDFAQQYIIDRIGVSMIYEPLVNGTGAAANVPSGQSGWFQYWRVGAGVATPAAFTWLANGN